MTAQLAAHLIAVSIGFAVTGLITSGPQPVARRRACVQVVRRRATALAALPVLFLTAPFTILGNAIRGRQLERRRFDMIMLAIIVAASWSLLSGTVLLVALTALGVPAG
jgi:hypothetical protein